MELVSARPVGRAIATGRSFLTTGLFAAVLMVNTVVVMELVRAVTSR